MNSLPVLGKIARSNSPDGIVINIPGRAFSNFYQGGTGMQDVTRKFTAIDHKTEIKEIVLSVYKSLSIKGYNPINQLVGYIISEDPTYITNYNNARSLICKVDRDELLQELLISYLEK